MGKVFTGTSDNLLQKDELESHKSRHLDAKNPKQASVIELLHDAAKRNDISIVQSLVLESHISPDSIDRKGWTATLRAAKSSSLKVLQFLLEYQANVNAQTKEGNSALHKAAKRNHPEVAKMLIGHRADLNSTNHAGVTPLMLSVMRQSSVLVFEAILAARPDVDMQKDVGYSALMLAARVGNGHAAHELLKAKANPELRDKQGETAYMKAVKYHRNEVAELLVQGGAVAHEVRQSTKSNSQTVCSTNSDGHRVGGNGTHRSGHRGSTSGHHHSRRGSSQGPSTLMK